MKKRLVFSLSLLLLGVLVLVGCSQGTTTSVSSSTTSVSSSTTTEPVIQLTYGSYLNETGPHGLATQAWIEKIEKETGNRVKITPYYSGTLISAMGCMDELQRGVADISMISGQFTPSLFPLDIGTRSFYYGIPYEKQREIYFQILDEFPQISDEFSSVKVLCYNTSAPSHLMSVKEVRTLDDIKGMTIRLAGDVGWVKALGAEAVNMGMGDVYLSLQKGIIDGAVAPDDTLKVYNFADVIKYRVVLDIVGALSPLQGMNLDSWNKLPPDIQQVFEDNMEFWGKETERLNELLLIEGLDYATQANVESVNLSASDYERFNQVLAEQAARIAAGLDEQGLPGSEILAEVQRLGKQ